MDDTSTDGPDRPPESAPGSSDGDSSGDGTADGVARRVGWALAGAGLVVGATAAGVRRLRHYAAQLTQAPVDIPEPAPGEDDHVTLVVVGAGHAVVTGPGAERPGTWTVVTTSGLARLGPIRERTAAGVRRDLAVLEGTVTPDHGVLTAYAHRNDATSLHPHGREVHVSGPVGAMPAHHVPGDDLWAIGVHGRAALRHETFRMLGPVVAAGHSALAVSYRNDRDGPSSPDRRSHLGGTEWHDVVAAMAHARTHGARRIVLVGCSMGGAIVGQVLRRASVEDVAGVLLDAPVVDWRPVALQAARSQGMSGVAARVLVSSTLAVTRTRHDVDVRGLRLEPDLLQVPTLLVHGTADEIVPISGSEVLAAARRDVISYLRVPEAGHVRSWNRDPGTYDAAVRTWLARL